MERNIALVQERAKNDADLDDTWVDDEREHEDLQRQVKTFHLTMTRSEVSPIFFFFISQLSSRNSSPDNDFVDVEGTERPHSSASASSQKFDGMSSMPLPEIKRGRGRPRKHRDNLEEGKCYGCDQCNDFFFPTFFSTECVQSYDFKFI